MESFISASDLDALTPENLLAVFRALLLCQQSLNHVDDSFTVWSGELVDPISDDIGIGYVFEGDFGRGESSKEPYIGVRSAA